jgi:long-chain acyl-CoA synthetase
MRYPNIYSLFRERVAEYAGRDVFYVRRGGEWRGISWEQFGADAHALASALLASGLTRGVAACVLMGNVPEWPVCDLGIIAAGGVSCGLYPTSSAEQCRYIIEHSDAEFVFVDTRAQAEKVLSVRDGLAKLKQVVVLEAGAEGARADDTAVMVYTSGTTGLPKGACLSHRYVLRSVESLRAVVPVYDTDAAFSYLPFCHVAERISGLYNRLYAGAPAYFVDDLTRLAQYMSEVRPTVFASLPRFFEKIHARVMADLERETGEARRRFLEALETGRRVVRLRQSNEEVPAELLDRYESSALPLLRRVKDYFGGRVRVATSGGAPLPLEVAEFFAAAGLPILQAYGLTENVCVAFNRPDRYKFGTVGPPMPGCEVRVEADGEILVRSGMMFSGYHKEPDKTAEVLRDGWLLTGDIGETDADGFLKITGRKKELIVLSTGKNVAPALVENMIKEHHLVSHAYVHGDGRSYLVALVTLNPFEAEEHARARGLRFDGFGELAASAEMRELVGGIIDSANRRVSSSESVRRFRILPRDFRADLEEVTPTLKLKRDVVARNFAEVLDGLYA